jgi:hypothetical protein
MFSGVRMPEKCMRGAKNQESQHYEREQMQNQNQSIKVV